jgi:hypothetical protein
MAKRSKLPTAILDYTKPHIFDVRLQQSECGDIVLRQGDSTIVLHPNMAEFLAFRFMSLGRKPRGPTEIEIITEFR